VGSSISPLQISAWSQVVPLPIVVWSPILFPHLAEKSHDSPFLNAKNIFNFPLHFAAERLDSLMRFTAESEILLLQNAYESQRVSNFCLIE
jgi:hypothetical protein